MTEEKFHALNEKVDSLIDLCDEMKRENQALRASEHSWESERRDLVDKNKQAKSRLEAILVRLKALDAGQ